MKAPLTSRAAELIRDNVEPDISDAAHANARMRFVEEASARPDGQRRWRAPALAIVAVAAVAVCVLFLRSAHVQSRHLAFTAGESPGKVGAYLAGIGQQLPLRFSDGSVVTLEKGARARVASTNANGASLQIESGTIHAHVVHRPDTKWHFAAGPYDVHVTGTEFQLSWDPAGVLQIVMQSGSVVVTGPGAEPGVVVRDRQRFTSEEHSRLESSANPAAAPPIRSGQSAPPTPGAQSGMEPAAPPASAPAIRSAARKVEPPTAASPSLRRLVSQGDYKKALDLARQRGVDSILSSGNVDDVSALADAARYTGHGALARRALLKLRSRFPSTTRGVSAAFLLGRMADDGGDAATALTWYDTYLKEAPSGGLAAEALGRRMLALEHLGNATQSQDAAHEYLKRFPNGPYAGVAREILNP